MTKHILATLATVVAVIALANPASAQLCGDVNGDGTRNIEDLVTMMDCFCGPAPPANFQPQNADMDPFPGFNTTDFVYLTMWMFNGGPAPCAGGPAGDDMVPGGQVSVEYVAGSMGPTTVATGYPLSFQVRITNDSPYGIMGISNGFKVYSPDGATVGGIACTSGTLYEDVWYLEAWTYEPVPGEPFGNIAFSIIDPGIYPGYDGVAYKVSLEPFAAEDAGKTVCFDSSYFGHGGTWMWSTDGQNRYLPSWDGPHCFTIEEAGYFPGDINEDGNIDIADVYNMVDYMFLSGPPPAAMEACDVNGNCTGPEIADLTYLVGYMFGGGDSPVFSCSAPGAKLASVSDKIVLYSEVKNGHTVVSISSEVDLAGLQLELALDDPPRSIEAIGDHGLDIVHGFSEGRLSLGMLDLQAASGVAAGTYELLRIDGAGELLSATVANTRFNLIEAQVSAAKGSSLPTEFRLEQNYPNPFNGATEIRFSLSHTSDVHLEVFDITGRSVTVLTHGSLSAGNHSVSWDGTSADGTPTSSGIYLYRLTADGVGKTRKMMYLK